MDRRKEARFQVYAPAKVALLDDPETEWNGQVIDISGLGLRLVAEVELHQDQIITIETDQHLILADVRNCEPRGSRFGVGAERVHSASKLSLPETASKAERNHLLVEDYHRRLLEELPGAPQEVAPKSSVAERLFSMNQPVPAPVQPEELLEPVAALEPIEEPAPLDIVATPEPIEEPEAIETPEPIEEPEPLAPVAALETIETPETPEPIAAPEPAPQSGPMLVEPPAAGAFAPRITPVRPSEIRLDPQEHLPFAVTPLKVSSNVIPIKPVAEPLPPSLENTEAKAIEEVPAVAEVAEVPGVSTSVDSADAIRQAFLQSEVQEAQPVKAKSRSSVLAILIAAAFTAVALGVIWFGPFSKRAPLQTFAAAQSTIAPATVPTPADSKPATETTPVPTPVPTQAPAQPAKTPPAPVSSVPVPAGQSRAVIEASASSWVTACSDGKVAFTKLFATGNKENLVFSSTAVVRVGNAGSLAISLNGKSIGSLGRVGQLRVVELTPSSTRFIPLHDPDGCTQ